MYCFEHPKGNAQNCEHCAAKILMDYRAAALQQPRPASQIVGSIGETDSHQPFAPPSGAITPPLPPPGALDQQSPRPVRPLEFVYSEPAHDVFVVSQDSWDCCHCNVQYGAKTRAETCAESHNCARDGRHYFSATGSSQCQVCRCFWQCPHPSCDKIFSSSRAAERCYSSPHGTTPLRSLRSGSEF
jgi:hypothetical protein